jgi:polar amino acid transport system ATP-binding protein
MVEAVNVWKSFGHVDVLKGIDLEVRRGEVMTLLGPSGSGKSTFLRLINHLETLSGGRLYVDGELIGYSERNGRLHELPPSAVERRRAEIGMVFQRFNLFPHMTALQNVILGGRLAHGESRAEAEDRGRALLARFGLEGREDDKPDNLSGGQQQRVAIARAFAGQPRALLLDEVTSALDPELIGEVLAAVRDLKAAGMTMVIATHEMSFAREVADEVAFLHEGRILELGLPDKVLGDPEHEETRRFLGALHQAGQI